MARAIPAFLALSLSSLGLGLGWSTAALAGGDVAKGALLFKRQCASCHALEGRGPDVGPSLDGLFDRAIDPADAEVVWDEESLDRLLADAAKIMSGPQRHMGLRRARDRADVIAYLKFVQGED